MQECQSLSVLSNLCVIVNIWKGKREPSFAEYERKFRGGAGNSRQEANNLEQRSCYPKFQKMAASSQNHRS
jgi:hypothetical protein